MKKKQPFPIAMAAAMSGMDDPDLLSLAEKATPDEQLALVNAIRAAYEAGQDASDKRTGRLMARIFGGFVGVTPGIDMNDGEEPATPRSRLVSVVRMLAQSGNKQ
jgi:hypothetical protein